MVPLSRLTSPARRGFVVVISPAAKPRVDGGSFFHLGHKIHFMKFIRFILLFGLLIIVGCSTASRFNHLDVGMTKQEVYSTLGEPNSSASPGGGVEILRYVLTTREDFRLMSGLAKSEYFVRLINGKVVSYGKMGDFDSTKDPTLDVNVKNR